VVGVTVAAGDLLPQPHGIEGLLGGSEDPSALSFPSATVQTMPIRRWPRIGFPWDARAG
jgi:hypothetical protein